MIRDYQRLVFLVLVFFIPFSMVIKGQDYAKIKLAEYECEEVIAVIEPLDSDVFERVVEELDIHNLSKQVDQRRNLYQFKINKNDLGKLLPFIASFDIRRGQAVEESFLSDYFPEVNAISAARIKYPSFFNFDNFISVKENDADPADIDLFNRVEASSLSSGKIMPHATDMSTIIAGNGSTFYTSKGIVPKARISTTDFNNLSPDPIAYFKSDSISIQNHSYGVEVEDYYGLEAREYDLQASQNPELLHVFSAGNSGQENPIFSQYSDIEAIANLTGTFKQAKNVLTVGAVDSFSVLTPESSKGPAHDGRIKPDLVAYGYNGTSDAAAIVSGCSAAIRQGLIENESPISSNLIKAILIAGAEDIGALGPDFQSGFGNVNLLKSLHVVKESTYETFSIEEGDSVLLDMEFDAPKTRVVLTWLDPPAEIDSKQALINDLDLKIVSEEGKEFYPFRPKHLPFEIMEGVVSDFGRDSINNTELIILEGAGKYRIEVFAKRVVDSTQNFSIAYYSAKPEHFQFIFPYEGSNIEVAKDVEVVFSKSSDEELSLVEFDENNSYNYPGSLTYLEAYPYLEGSAISSSGNFSSVEFSVSNVPRTRVIWACEDSISFAWDNEDNAQLYQVLKFAGAGLELKDSTFSGHYTISNEDSGYYAVRAKLEEGIYGPHSLIINTSESSASCLYTLFEGQKLEDQIELSIDLVQNPPYQALKIQKWDGKQWTQLSSLDVNLESQTFTDSEVIVGINEYRLEFIINKESIYSDVVEVIFVPDDEVAIFPSLTSPEFGIDIVQGKFRDLDIHLYDLAGRLVIKEKVLSEYEFLTLDGVPNGLYFYSLFAGNLSVGSGKLMFLGQ